MKKIIYLRVETDPLESPENLFEKLEQIEGFEFFEFTPETAEKKNEEEKEWIYKVGLTQALNTGQMFEWLGKPGDDKPTIIFHLQRFLDNVITTDHLTIIDPYFFAKTRDPHYDQFVIDILGKYIPNLNSFHIITSPDRIEASIKTNLETKIKLINPTIIINHQTTDLFHDRFWISDFTKTGLYVGHSLNGLGKKYCVVDYLQQTDVVDISNQLILNGLK